VRGSLSSPRGFSAATRDERRNADLFYAGLLGLRGPARLLRSDRAPRARTRPGLRRPPGESYEYDELVEICGFFGPNNVRRTEQDVRNAVVARANAEWTSWHDTAGVPRREGEADMFGRLVGYYLGAKGSILPDTLTAMQAAAPGGIDFTALLAATGNAATIAAEATRIRGLLLAGAPGASDVGLTAKVESAITQARHANKNSGIYKAWSAAFTSSCVRGAGISQGLEGVIGPGRQHVGRDTLLFASLKHAEYTVQARFRRAATTPRRRGTYHAFTPAERAPQLGDIIVQDRRDGITAAQVAKLATLRDLSTHGDIVVDVQEQFVVTIGGNLGGSARKRRYPKTAQGLLVVDRQQRYTQETNTGTLPDLPSPTNAALADLSTARIFALLSPVEECAAVPGQPYHGGILT
jgi:hypothetical protein